MQRPFLQSSNKNLITAGDMSPAFAAEVREPSGTTPALCWHCRCCAGGCPFYEAMDIAPNNVIRLVQLGLKEEALRGSIVWVCG